MFEIINNLTEISRLNTEFIAKMQANNPIDIKEVRITWPSGKRIETVQFLEKYELYYFHELNVNKASHTKHLNLFVTSDLVKRKHINRNTQINFLADPNLQPKGAFAKDTDNHFYVLYNGKTDPSFCFPTIEAYFSSGKKKQYVLVCQLDAPDFMDQLMVFVKKCEEIKKQK